MNELRRILKTAGLTSIYVTHDQQEAFAIADRVAIMNAGRIVQTGAPQEVYRSPASEWVARFLGLTNLLKGVVEDSGAIRTPIGTLYLNGALPTGESLLVLIRPDAALLKDEDGTLAARGQVIKDEEQRANRVEGVIVEKSFRGGHTRSVIRAGEVDLVFEFNASADLPDIGEKIRLSLDSDSISILACDV